MNDLNQGTEFAGDSFEEIIKKTAENPDHLDYQNRLTYYIAVHLGHLVNWDFATDNLARV